MPVPEFAMEAKCGACPIRRSAVCSRCNAHEYEILEEIKYYRHYDAGQMIVWAGDEMGFVGSVVTGVAALSQTLEDGRKQMVGLSLPSDFIGWPGRESPAFDVQALAPVTMCCFRRRPFEELLGSTPHVAERLLEMTMDELDSARQWMLILGRKTAREKIASFLSNLAYREAQLAGSKSADGQTHFTLPLTREAIADYLGMTLETVSRQLSALRRDGTIALDGTRRVMVPDLRRLELAAGGEMASALERR